REPVGPEPPGLVYVGDAVFVQGTRPDVARGYPGYPTAGRAGWGYMLLTNFLPNNGTPKGMGNGMYMLHALAHNQVGLTVDLGTRAITVNNSNATLPFGTIDTPGQGATIYGTSYVNFGWALTPMPGVIPADGLTMTVNVDGVTLGHPTYGQFRGDIATLFPGYANSNGAIGFLIIDTTKLTNGLHTISWGLWDNKIRGNGIGSRFFTVLNAGAGLASTSPETSQSTSSEPAISQSPDPSQTVIPERATPDEERSMNVEERARIELPLGAASGYSADYGDRQPLPVGS